MGKQTREIPKLDERRFRETVEIERLDLPSHAMLSIRGGVETTRPTQSALPSGLSQGGGIPVQDLVFGEVIAEGGMGVIRRGRQVSMKREVAIKTTYQDDTAAARQAILSEAHATGQLEHPNIIPIYVLAEDGRGAPVIVMKKIEGVTWDEVIQDPGKAPVDQLIDLDFHVDVFLKVIDAVRFSHSRGIVHRDIKPENVMIGHFGEVYLLDWGLAVAVSEEAPDFVTPVRDASGLRGTPAYMAPEMTLSDASLIDERTDVFLLGATLFHVLFGTAPFWDDSPIKSLVRANQCQPYRPGREAPSELAAVARRAMARAPDERFASVEGFRDAVLAYRSHRDASALTREAERRMERIKTLALSGAEAVKDELVESFFETRYALRRAAQKRPDDPKAPELLSRLAKLMFEYFLERNDLGSAQGCLVDIYPSDRQPYQMRLTAAQREYSDVVAEIKQIRYDRDSDVDLDRRVLLGIAISMIWACSAFYKAWQRWGIEPELVPRNYLESLVLTVGVPLIAVMAFRKLMASNEFNRRVFFFVLAGLSAVTFMRVAAWHYDVSWHVTTTMEHAMYCLIAFYFGVVTDMRMARASIVLVIAAVLGVFFPMYQMAFMGGAFLLFAPYQAWLWYPHKSK